MPLSTPRAISFTYIFQRKMRRPCLPCTYAAVSSHNLYIHSIVKNIRTNLLTGTKAGKLPQRQSCQPREWHHPFRVTSEKEYDYSCIQEEYFNRVCEYLDEMKIRNMQPLLVLLWGNFVPGTWQGERDKKRRNVEDKPYYLPMTEQEMEKYLEYIVPRLKEYEPIFLVSGDVNLSDVDTDSGKKNPETVSFYQKALQITKRLAPDCLTTFHIIPKVELPERLIQAPELDFYMYQPGHTYKEPELNRTLAQNIRKYGKVRPIYNAETSYEANVYFDGSKGRFDERQVRNAFWQGVLHGATAGFTYGAGGVWLWRQNQNVCSEKNEYGLVNNWRDDLRLQGAYDMGFAKLLADIVGFYDLQPMPELVLNNPCGEIGCAVGNDWNKIVIYLPFSWPLQLDINLSDYDVWAIDLETRWALKPSFTVTDGKTEFGQDRYNHDCVILAKLLC